MGLASVLGIGAGVLLVSVLAVRLWSRLGLPSLLLYLGIGLALGQSGIRLHDAALIESIGLAALVLILADGGLSTRWSAVSTGVRLGLVLATVGVVVSVGVTGTVLHFVLSLDWRTALLWGAVLSSTDSAAVFSVLRGTGIGRRLIGTLELETGLNDASAYLIVIVLAGQQSLSWWTPLFVVYELIAGGAIGVALGWLGAAGLRRAALPATGLYPLATVGVCVLAYAAGQGAHASGLLATYAAGVMLGNAELPHRSGTLSFVEGLGALAQIGLFVLLGLYATPQRLPGVVLAALTAGAVLLLVARPISVLVSGLPFRVPWPELGFLSWAGLRGAVPIVFALIPLAAGYPDGQRVFDMVFVVVVVLTVLQGLTLPLVGRRLGLVQSALPTEIEIDAAPLERMGADLLQVRVPTGSRMHGVYLSELRLPQGATVSLVVRDDVALPPDPTYRIQEGDQLLVVAAEKIRPATERRIRAIDRAGRYARWRGFG